jgi:hypothetical protein
MCPKATLQSLDHQIIFASGNSLNVLVLGSAWPNRMAGRLSYSLQTYGEVFHLLLAEFYDEL